MQPHEFPVMGNHSRGRAGSTGSVDEVSMRSWAHEPLQSRGSDSFLMNGSDDNETEVKHCVVVVHGDCELMGY